MPFSLFQSTSNNKVGGRVPEEDWGNLIDIKNEHEVDWQQDQQNTASAISDKITNHVSTERNRFVPIAAVVEQDLLLPVQRQAPPPKNAYLDTFRMSSGSESDASGDHCLLIPLHKIPYKHCTLYTVQCVICIANSPRSCFVSRNKVVRTLQ